MVSLPQKSGLRQGFEQPIGRSYWAQRTKYWTKVVKAAKSVTLICPHGAEAVSRAWTRRASLNNGRITMAAETQHLEPMPEALALSKLEAARMLGVSLRTVDRLIALKQLPVRRLGRRVLIPRNNLQSLLRSDHPTQSA